MELFLKRILDNKQATIGDLYIYNALDAGGLFCHTLEDTFRHDKIAGETRIPAGRYQMGLRYGSPMANRYQEKFGTNGMLQILDIPNYKYVYLHIGNTDEETLGCPLVGAIWQSKINNGLSTLRVLESTTVYKKLHSIVAPVIEAGYPEIVFITILDN